MRRFETPSILLKDSRSIPLQPELISKIYKDHSLRKGLSSKSVHELYSFIESLAGNLIHASFQSKLLGLTTESPNPTPQLKKKVIQIFKEMGYIDEVRRGYYYKSHNLDIPLHDVTKIKPNLKTIELFNPKKQQSFRGWEVIMRRGNQHFAMRDRTAENGTLHKFSRDFQKRVNVPIKRMTRIFTMNELSGGRVYSNYQLMNKEFRQFIKIDNQPTIELDYQYNQIKMIFKIFGKDLDEDPYEGFSHDRAVVKKAMNALVNAKNPKRVFCDKRWASFFRWTTTEADDFISEVSRRYPLLERLIGSGVGLRLQKLEGDIALEIMRAAHKDNKVVLPVHDSFIVRQDNEKWLDEMMEIAWDMIVGNVNPASF